MTTIISFYLDNGNQMIIIGDTQHTYEHTTKEESKIREFNEILFCGAGYDRIIWDLFSKTNTLRSFERCADKIIELKKEKIDEYTKYSSTEMITQVQNSEFLVIDTKKLLGNKIIYLEKNKMGNIEVLGTGINHITTIQEKVKKAYSSKFSDLVVGDIISLFNDLGKMDPYTGHPAVFPVEIYLLEKDKKPIKYLLKFKHNLESKDNYEVVKND